MTPRSSNFFPPKKFPPPGSARLKHPLVVCVLDGWGQGDPKDAYNAIAQAKTPTWDLFLSRYPSTQLEASGIHVGLPHGQMGNSEIGHLTLGSGRVTLQSLPRISQGLGPKDLLQNPGFQKLISTLKKTGGVCHVMGLFSAGGVHAHIDHALALIKELTRQSIPVYLHWISDGRDTDPYSARSFYEGFLKSLSHLPHTSFIKEASLCGRFYAMDRDHRWDRTESAYRLISQGQGIPVQTISQGLQKAYQEGFSDETIPPFVVDGYKGVQPQDGLLCFNFRPDRMRQLMGAFFNPHFKEFPRANFPLFAIGCSAVDYSKELAHYLVPLFPKEKISETLGEILSRHHFLQLRLSETEKFAHVTYFLNGGHEKSFPDEYRLLIPSPHVANYQETPAMSALQITQCLSQALLERRFDIIVVNYANADMLGHTGDFKAAQEAIEILDKCLGALYMTVQKTNSVLVLTADHGNAEEMFSQEGSHIKTSHTLNPVPFLVVNAPDPIHLRKGPSLSLADVMPTILDLLEIPVPAEVTGTSLIEKTSAQ